MGSDIHRGYLVLADITGFTRFVAGTELDHSKAILGDILNLVIRAFRPVLEIAEIEGDAVFAYASDQQLPRGETLLEIIEATYVDFRDQKRSAQRSSICDCRACQMSPQLDLKFITHHGDFVLHDIAGKQKPLGSSVNLLHRLAKNTVGEVTGWQGYALFTEESLTRMDVHPLNIHRHVESYEHLGDVRTFSVNLDDRYKELTEERYFAIDPHKAHVSISEEFPVAPPVIWEWLNDPVRRDRWMVNNDWRKGARPQGRISRGATNHCAKSGFIEKVLDWRPFSYFTIELTKKPIRLVVTSRLSPVTNGTRVVWSARVSGSLPEWILRPICRLLVAKGAKAREGFDALLEILSQQKDENAVA